MDPHFREDDGAGANLAFAERSFIETFSYRVIPAKAGTHLIL